MQWRRPLPNESSEQYAAYRAYRDQPAHDRNLEDVALLLDKDYANVEEWCALFFWEKRSLSYDTHQDTLQRKRLERSRSVRDNLSDHLAVTGASMLIGASIRAEQIEHNPGALKPADLAKYVHAGRDFVTAGSSGSQDQQLADRLTEHATDEQLEELGRLENERAAILARILPDSY